MQSSPPDEDINTAQDPKEKSKAQSSESEAGEERLDATAALKPNPEY
jgi:hypothetical protein